MQLPHALATCALLRRPPRLAIAVGVSPATLSDKTPSAGGRGSGGDTARVAGGFEGVVDSESAVVPVAGLSEVVCAAEGSSSSIVAGSLAPETESIVTS